MFHVEHPSVKSTPYRDSDKFFSHYLSELLSSRAELHMTNVGNFAYRQAICAVLLRFCILLTRS